MNSSSISEYSSLVTAGVSIAGFLCTGIAALWGRLEYTNRKIQSALAHAQKALKQCERREIAARDAGAHRTTIIELLCQAMESLSPGSALVKRARRSLDEAHRNREIEDMQFDQETDDSI